MSEPTVTLRFPRRLHAQAKIEATRRSMSLQDFVEQAVESSLGKEAPPPNSLPPIAGRFAALPERSRKLAVSFIELLEMAPEFYIRAIEKHIAGLKAVFGQFDKRYFEKGHEDPKGKTEQ